MINKSTVFKIAIMLGIAIFAFASVSCNDPKPTTPTQRTMSNGTVVKGDAGITQKQLDGMVVILEDMYNNGFNDARRANFDANVTAVQVKANGTEISHSGKNLTIAADSVRADIMLYLGTNSLVMQLMNDFRLASTAKDVIRFYLDT